jgi:hypothetical protein
MLQIDLIFRNGRLGVVRASAFSYTVPRLATHVVVDTINVGYIRDHAVFAIITVVSTFAHLRLENMVNQEHDSQTLDRVHVSGIFTPHMRSIHGGFLPWGDLVER